MQRRLLLPVLIAPVLLAGVVACDTIGSDDAPTPPATGSYETQTLTVQTDTGSVNALARGTFIEMRLQPDNTVTDGVLMISPGFTEEDVDGSRRVEFAGTWSQTSDSTVTFDHEADTFIRDTDWHFANDTLRTNNGEVNAVLRKQEDS